MSKSRRGFSLMEVLLATSILLGSSIALIELATIGRKQAHAAYDLNVAQLLCQAKLDEIVAGIEPVESVESAELEDDPGWFYSVEIEPLIEFPNLVSVTVSVFQISETISRPIRFTLVRWLPDDLAEDLTPNSLATDPVARDSGTGESGTRDTRTTSNRPAESTPGRKPDPAISGRTASPFVRPLPRGVTP